MIVLLAVADDDLREALTLLLEDAGCEVRAVDRAHPLLPDHPWAAQSAVVALDAHFGEVATERILALAEGEPCRHRYVILATLGSEHWPSCLVRFARREHAPVLQLPNDLDRLVPTVSLLRAAQRAALTHCGPPRA
jgi:hypothetical protein